MARSLLSKCWRSTFFAVQMPLAIMVFYYAIHWLSTLPHHGVATSLASLPREIPISKELTSLPVNGEVRWARTSVFRKVWVIAGQTEIDDAAAFLVPSDPRWIKEKIASEKGIEAPVLKTRDDQAIFGVCVAARDGPDDSNTEFYLGDDVFWILVSMGED